MVRINLLPWRETQQAQRRRQFLRLFLVSVLATSLMLITLYGYNLHSLQTYTEQNRELEHRMRELIRPLSAADQLIQQQTALYEYKDRVYNWQINQAQSVRLLDELVNTLPTTLTLHQMTQQGEQITLQGQATASRDISVYIRQLATSPWLRDPQLTITTPDEQTGVHQFRVTVRHVPVPVLSGTP